MNQMQNQVKYDKMLHIYFYLINLTFYLIKITQMLECQNSPRIKLINLLVPPSNNPLLTPYTKRINSKILPLKRQFSILSNLKSFQQQKILKISLNKQDIEKVNRSYKSLTRYKLKNNQFNHNNQVNNKDSQYLRLIQLRTQMVNRKKLTSSKDHFMSKTSSNLMKESFDISGFLNINDFSIAHRKKQNSQRNYRYDFNKEQKYRIICRSVANIMEREDLPQIELN